MSEMPSMESPSEEIPEKKRKGKISKLIEAGAFAIAMSAYDQGPARALEIPSNTPWHEGITKNVKESVENDKGESAFTYVKFSNNEGEWLKLGPNIVTEKNTSVRYDVANYAKMILENPNYNNLEIICRGHSHPAEAFRSVTPNSNDYKRISAPPSSIVGHPNDFKGDISSIRAFENGLSHFGIPKEKLMYFESDANGIWYYRKATGMDYKNESERKGINTPGAIKKHNKVHDELSYKSLEPSFDIRSSKEYVDLRESFRLNAGGVVRFVPYEKINSEPMCAGVDFKPNIRAVSDKKNESRTEDGRTVIDLSSKIKPTNIRLPQ